MINSLVEEELFGERFALDWTVGFEDLCSYVQHFRPEVVADITGIPAEKVRELARRIASARRACPVIYTGLEHSDSGVQANVRSAEARMGQVEFAQSQQDVVLGLLSCVAMLTALFIILSTLSMGMLERITQLGLLRCIGTTESMVTERTISGWSRMMVRARRVPYEIPIRLTCS